MTSSTPPQMQQQNPMQAAGEAIQNQQQGSLPPTGVQAQMNSLNNLYSQTQQQQGVGYDPRLQQFAQAQAQPGGSGLQSQGGGAGMGTSLDQTARNLAQRYGLPIGNGRLVDENGNFLYNPQQMADASGGQVTMGEAEALMNHIGQALTQQREGQAREQSLAALQTGLGQVQSRGRGSLAGMMSGYYRDIANMYQQAITRGDYETADFNYYIEKEQLEIQQELQRREEKLAKKQARFGMLGGVAMTAIGFGTGNVGVGLGGVNQIVGSAGGTGWFDG